MAQAASRFTTWLDSCQPVLLSEFNALAANVPPDIFEGVVEEVNCYGVDYDSGYILVHCRPVLWPPAGVGIIRHRFRLKYGGGLDYSQQEGNSFPAVTIWQDPNLAERLPPMLFQGRWLALRGQPAESNSPKCLKLQNILEMCEYLSRREFISANGSSFSASGPGWFYFALSECLRGCQSCFGGSWLGFHTTVFISGWGIRAIIEARDRYLKEKHPDCCYSSSPNLPNPSPEYPERGPATSATKQPSRTNIVASRSSQPRTLPLGSAELSNDLVGTSNRGKTRALKANRLRLSLPPSVTKQMSVPESEGTKISGQLKEAYPSTVVRRSSEENNFEASNFQEPIVAAKRTIVISEEAEGRKFEANKRIKVAHVGEAKERSGFSASKGNDANKLTSSGISKAMPLSSVISLLIRHGCQDITQTLDLPACTEYPIFSGGFGDIFRGKLNNNVPVAIKCMRIVIDPYSSEHAKYLKCAAREIHTWSKLDHRYVSKLLGLAQFRGQIAMVSPWAEHGALPGFLTRRPEQNRPRLCAQIADGLAFLHEHKIVHGDLKGANVLISESYEPLLIDFGNAILHDRSLQFTHTTAKSNFSLRWTAPELLYGAPCSFEADVYALGMTILEIITGEVPYARLHDMAVLNSINSKQHPKRPDEHIPNTSVSGEALWSLLTRCWAFEPKSRPPVEWAQDVMEMINPEGLIPGVREEDLGWGEPEIGE